MSDVFISYARSDQGFVYKLQSAIKATGREAWVDWRDIPPTVEWWQEIQREIEGANTFVFVLSPDSVNSTIRQREIEHALLHHKRIVAIVHRDGFEFNPLSAAHTAIKQRQWVFFTAQFEKAFQKLLELMDADLEYVRVHTRLLVRSLEWDANSRSDAFLLRGEELTAAEAWLETSDHGLPPTQQQETYIVKSREVEDATARILHQKRRAQRMVGIGSAVLAIAIATTAALSFFSARTQRQLEAQRLANAIDLESVNALRQFDAAQLPSLLTALRQARQLDALAPNARSLDEYPTLGPIFALRSMLSLIREQNQIRTSSDNIVAIAFSPDSKLMATGGDGKLQIWTIDGEARAEIRLPSTQGIRALGFDEQGKEVRIVWQDSSIGRWDLSGKRLDWVQQNVPIKQAQFTPDRKFFRTLRNDGKSQIWSIAGRSTAVLNQPLTFATVQPPAKTGQLFWVREFNRLAGNRVQFSPDGQRLVTGRKDGTIELWDLVKSLPELRAAHEGPIYALSFSPDGRYFATAGAGKTVRLWSLTTQTPAIQVHQSEISGVSVLPDGAIATASQDGNALLWDFAGLRQAELHSSKVPIRSITSNAEGSAIATGDNQGVVRLFDRKGKEITFFKASDQRINQLKFSPNGTQILTATESGAKLWSLSGELIQDLDKSGRINAIAFRPDGKLIATATKGQVNLWESGRLVRSISVNQTEVTSLVFSSGGSRLLTGGADGIVTIWNASGEKILAFQAHPSAVLSLDLHRDGQQVLTGGANGTTRLWALSGQQLGEWKGNQAAFSKDGLHLIAGDQSGVLRVIENDKLPQLLTKACLWLREYLTHNPNADQSDRQLCPPNR